MPHGMNIKPLAFLHSLAERCSSCPYGERVDGCSDVWRCAQGIMEGPLLWNDGCTFLSSVRSGSHSMRATRVREKEEEPIETRPTEPAPSHEEVTYGYGEKVIVTGLMVDTGYYILPSEGVFQHYICEESTRAVVKITDAYGRAYKKSVIVKEHLRKVPT